MNASTSGPDPYHPSSMETLIGTTSETMPPDLLPVVWAFERGRILFVSDTVEDALGFSPQEVTSSVPADLHRRIHPDDLDRLSAACETLLQGGPSISIDFRFFRKDGRCVWLFMRARSVVRPDGERVVHGVVSDVTARKELEKSLRERISEEELVASISTRLLKAKAAEIDMAINSCLEEIAHHVGADRSSLYVGLREGEEIIRPYFWKSSELDLKDLKMSKGMPGLRGWVERILDLKSVWVDSASSSVTDPERAILHQLGVRSALLVPFELGGDSVAVLASSWIDTPAESHQNLSMLLRKFVRIFAHTMLRKESEEQLGRSERHFRSLIEGSSEVIAIMDERGYLSYGSPSIRRVLGYRSNELVGRSVFDLVHRDELDQVRRRFDVWLASDQTSCPFAFRFRHADGSWRCVEAVATDLRDDEQISGIVVNARDVTERVLLERKVEQNSRMTSLGNLAATVAHEFNNVLMGVQTFAELVGRKADDPATVRRGASQILRSLERGKRVSTEILRFTRPPEPVLRRIAVREWLEEFSHELESLLPGGIDLQLDLAADVVIEGDCVQLEQVLSNLLLNARDAMPEGGAIILRLGPGSHSDGSREGERFAEISLSDSGSGMKPEVLRHIFDPLFTTKRTGGTGLGLAVVHQIISAHRGSIAVETALGEGSTFRLRLPLAPESAAESSMP
ncbi:MAG: PAS domain S-box protein [Thermoanaerobaculia bacterium]